MKNLAKAIVSVMTEVKGIEKSMTVGNGPGSYQGVPDAEVKKIIGESMAKNGLTILPISIDPKTEVTRWSEESTYNGKTTAKQKQSVFTQVVTKYLLLHESGESLELAGYGQGVDSQDKGAGKATTYALKYALLYAFLVPTGKIDDTDAIHSDDLVDKNIPRLPTINQAVYEINLCTTLDGLKSVWDKYRAFHTSLEFITAKDLKKGALANE